jgi:hypothetical protein
MQGALDPVEKDRFRHFFFGSGFLSSDGYS